MRSIDYLSFSILHTLNSCLFCSNKNNFHSSFSSWENFPLFFSLRHLGVLNRCAKEETKCHWKLWIFSYFPLTNWEKKEREFFLILLLSIELEKYFEWKKKIFLDDFTWKAIDIRLIIYYFVMQIYGKHFALSL